jgi:hypothetical protein
MTIRNLGSNGPTIMGRMSDFDKLPKAAREALRYADHNWSGTQLLRVYRRKQHGIRTAADCARVIRDHDARVHRRDAEAGIVCPDQR